MLTVVTGSFWLTDLTFFFAVFLKFLWMWITCTNQNKTNWWLIQQTSSVRDCVGRGVNGRASGPGSSQSGEHRRRFLCEAEADQAQSPPYRSQRLPQATRITDFDSHSPVTLSTLEAGNEPCLLYVSLAAGKEPGSKLMCIDCQTNEWMQPSHWIKVREES